MLSISIRSRNFTNVQVRIDKTKLSFDKICFYLKFLKMVFIVDLIGLERVTSSCFFVPQGVVVELHQSSGVRLVEGD